MTDTETSSVRPVGEWLEDTIGHDTSHLLSYSPRSGDTLLFSEDGNGLKIVREHLGRVETLRSLNGWARNVAQTASTSFKYTSEDGNILTGCIIYPVGYEKGRRYPLLTWVYAGQVYRTEECRDLNGLSH